MNHVLSGEIPSKDLFMMCKNINRDALSNLPSGYHFRLCRRDELDVWKKMHLETPEMIQNYLSFMDEYFQNVYAKNEDLFFEKCLFACDENDTPVGRCFAWLAYSKINTIHWYKVVKEYEGQGIGRAILSEVMRTLKDSDFPVYLHTHPSSFRAIKLYSDMGFAFLANPIVGNRTNDLEECIPILKNFMPEKDFKNLKFSSAPQEFLDAVLSSPIAEF